MLTVLFTDGGAAGQFNAKAWRILQVSTFIAFPQPDAPDGSPASADVLVIVVAQNDSSEARCLDVVHRGDVRATPVSACPLPAFPRDAPGEYKGDVGTYLRRRFRVLSEAYQFRPRASRYRVGKEWMNVSPWDPPSNPKEWYWPRHDTSRQCDVPPPYTLLRLGEFAENSTHVIALRVSVIEEAFDQLIGDRERFSLDGAGIVASCIEYQDLAACTKSSPRREEFRRPITESLIPSYYELFLARPRLSFPYHYCSCTPCLVPVSDVEEDNRGSFDHFVTNSPEFSMSLRFGAVRPDSEGTSVPGECIRAGLAH